MSSAHAQYLHLYRVLKGQVYPKYKQFTALAGRMIFSVSQVNFVLQKVTEVS